VYEFIELVYIRTRTCVYVCVFSFEVFEKKKTEKRDEGLRNRIRVPALCRIESKASFDLEQFCS